MSNHDLSSNSSKQTSPTSDNVPARSQENSDRASKQIQRSVWIAQLLWALIYISWTAYLIYVAVQIQKQ